MLEQPKVVSPHLECENAAGIRSYRISPMFPVVHPVVVDLLGLLKKNLHDHLPFSDLLMLPDQPLTCFNAPATVISNSFLDTTHL